MLEDAGGCNRKLMSWFENPFLDAPVQNFGDVEFVFGGAGDFVNPAKLSELLAGFAEDAENFSVEREFVDTARESIGGVEHLVWPGRDANGPGCAGCHGAGGGGGLVADGGAGVGIDGNIYGDDAKEFSIGVEDLDAAIAAIGDVNVIARIDGDAMRCVELTGLIAGFAPGLEPVVVFVDFDGVREGPGVEVVADFAEKFSVGSEFEELRGTRSIGGAGAVGTGEDEDVSFRIDGDAGGFAEMEIGRKFQEVGNRVVADFGRLLGEKRSGHEKKKNDD